MIEDKTKDGKKRSRPATPKELESMAIELLGVFETSGQGGKEKYRLTEERLKDVVGAERNAWMIRALSLWLQQRGNDPKQPKTTTFPKKPKRGDPQEGPFTGPEIKSVKVNAGTMSGFEVRGGIVQNDSMLRVDLFTKAGKFYLVPVYVYHAVTKELPNRSIVAHKDEAEWTVVDGSFEFLFSVYPNDFVAVRQRKERFSGYYAGCDRGSGNMNLWAHDRNSGVGKDGLMRGIGVKTALSVEKYNVDVLGNIYPAPKEPRRGLA